MKSVLKPLAKSDAAMQQWYDCQQCSTRHGNTYKILGSGETALITSNEEMDDIMKIVKYLEESGLLIKGDSN